MQYRDFQECRLSRLGFGTMRLPLLEDGSIDQAQLERMTDYALAHGVNYFDTALPYHGGMSEIAIGRALARHPRESFYLADKYPGHQISERYDPEATFEEQLKKCGVDYFDFYLLHNVNESSVATYQDERWGIIDYFVRQRACGRIRHLGFSCHSRVEGLRDFLDFCGDKMEFCQIQLNYLDWTLQRAGEKYALLTERGIPVWVMEPVRGGKLAHMGQQDEDRLRALRPEESVSAWAFRFLQELDNVQVVLSGMSNLEQMIDNVKTFSDERPLAEAEKQLLLSLAEKLKNALPCTGCRYCCDGCPAGLDIPLLISLYNDARLHRSINVLMALDALGADKQPSCCIGCGQCSAICPQGIDVPGAMRACDALISAGPSWAEVCAQREAAASKARSCI